MIIFARIIFYVVTIKYARNVDGNVNIYYSVRVQICIGVRCFLSIRVPEQICNFPLYHIGGINLDKIKNTNWFAGLVKRRMHYNTEEAAVVNNLFTARTVKTHILQYIG